MKLLSERPIFKTLQYVSLNKWGKDKKTKIMLFIPGVNSGAYDKALHIQMVSREQTKGIFSKEKVAYTEITLNREQVEELKKECEKILSL